ncbi:MAG: PQQ-binding-like beta-propeller repeat protein, partial [Pirellulales bacterium]
ELWKFYSEGPVRFAPVAWEDGLYFGSDDGFLYHLDASTGKLRWKVRGAPDDRADYRQLGNNRFISLWPVRGGPVIENGVVYFGAGIWPTMGVFVKAVDARSGDVNWANGDINYLANVRIDHNTLNEAALSPQGYCLYADGKVVVPNGRSMPARFEPDTGKLLYFVQGYRRGDSRVTATDEYLFVGEQAVVRLKDGREVGDRWASAGKEAPNGFDARKLDLFEGPMLGYKFMAACDYRSALDDGKAYGVSKGYLFGWDVKRAKVSLYEKERGGVKLHPARWDAPPLWGRVHLKNAETNSNRVTIKSGNRIYTHVGKTLFAIELAKNEGQPEVAWKKELDAEPTSLLAADGKLFAILAEGRILCFGDQPVEVVKKHELPKRALVKRGEDDPWAKRAAAALAAAGTDQGYAVVLGLEEGALVEELLGQSGMKVIAFDPDRDKVERLRETLIAADLYASRAEVFVGDPLAIRWPPYLANLIVSERAGASSPLAGMKEADLFELLRPYGGALVAEDGEALRPRYAAAKRPDGIFKMQGARAIIRRPGALKGSADWTHETGDASRAYFSHDKRVRAPLGILWYGDGEDHGFEKHKDYGRGVKPQVAEGRLVAFDDIRQELRAIDIYTGRVLWKRKTDTPLVRYVTFADAVYVASDLKCDVLDPPTGAVRESLPLRVDVPKGKKAGVVAVRANEEMLLIGIGFDLPADEHSHSAMDHGLWDARVLVLLDRKSGEQLWTRAAEHRFNLHSIAMGGGLVFASDSISPSVAGQMERRGTVPDTFPSTVLALDQRTGELRWQKQFDYKYRNMLGRGPLAIRPYDDWQAYHAEQSLLLTGKSSEMRAIDAKTGEEKWHSDNAGLQPLILSAHDFINQAGHRFEVATGRILTSKPLFKRGACNYTVGSDAMLFLRYKSAAYVDLKKGQQFSLRNLRSGCSNSLVAAGGLLNVPSFATGCVCNYPVQTSFSMVYMPETGKWAGETPRQMSVEVKND